MYDFTISPELWYTHPAIKNHIKKPRWENLKGQMLQSVKNKIKNACKITYHEAFNYKENNWYENSPRCLRNNKFIIILQSHK